MRLQAWNCGSQRVWYLFSELLTHIAKLASRKAGLCYFQSACLPARSPAWDIMPVASFSVFLPESCAFPAKGGRGQDSPWDPQSWILGHPQSSLLPTLLLASALPTEAGPVAQMCLEGLGGCGGEGWEVRGGQSQGEEERARHLEEPVLAGERVCECWNAGWEERPRPPHRRLCCLSSRAGWRHPTRREEGGGMIDAPSRPPGSGQG